MDPDKALDSIRILSQSIADATKRGDGSISPDTALGLVEAVQGLDGWLSRGGYPPTAWDHEDCGPDRGECEHPDRTG